MSAEPMKVNDRRAMAVLAGEQPPTTAVTSSPVDTLLNAIQRHPDMDLAKLEKLMDLAERWRAAEAKRAYIAAKAAFKRNMPDVIKDMFNKQYGSDYSSLANLVNKTNPYLSEYGLEASWRPEPDYSNGIVVKCILQHVDGHHEEVTLKGPPDTSGQKNPLQQIKSTLTYLEVATFQAITGVVARSACADDDGNGAGNKKPEVKAPQGYDKWRADMKALADEGTARLQEAWKNSNEEYRRHAVDHDDLWWKETKRAAAKVQA